MGGIDRLISNALTNEIKKKMDMELLNKVERKLFLEHGMSIKLSIEHFQKFQSILKKNPNIESDKFGLIIVTKYFPSNFFILRILLMQLFSNS